jgi:hypothetical protein
LAAAAAAASDAGAGAGAEAGAEVVVVNGYFVYDDQPRRAVVEGLLLFLHARK